VGGGRGRGYKTDTAKGNAKKTWLLLSSAAFHCWAKAPSTLSYVNQLSRAPCVAEAFQRFHTPDCHRELSSIYHCPPCFTLQRGGASDRQQHEAKLGRKNSVLLLPKFHEDYRSAGGQRNFVSNGTSVSVITRSRDIVVRRCLPPATSGRRRG
jgi:hypothetical protein